MQISIRRGKDVDAAGNPAAAIRDGMPVDRVALQGSDFPGLRPDLKVKSGDQVAAGQVLFVDRHRAQIAFVSPVSGVVQDITLGRRRVLDLLVIQREGDRAAAFSIPESSDREKVRALLLQSGQWPAFRTRPFGRIPDPEAVPQALFVTAMNTEPLGEDATVVLGAEKAAFRAGLEAIRHLTSGRVHVCQAPGAPVVEPFANVDAVQFSGPHPAGLPGTHIHFLSPVTRARQVWHIGYQDVIAIGHLMGSGRIHAGRVVALGGAGLQLPGHVRTVSGANLGLLLAGETVAPDVRIFSGSILSGRAARYLGRYHTQVSVLPPVPDKARSAFAGQVSKWFGLDQVGPIIPVAAYDRVMPFNLPVVPLLRALSMGDGETAEMLGCLELCEEDMALLTHVCPAGHDYADLLRRVLDKLEKEGS